MKKEYLEGNIALENFKEGMKALFKVPKDEVVKVEKRKKRRVPPALRPCVNQDLPTRTRRARRFPRPCRYVARRFIFAC